MFERYTERARRVLFFARYEASQYGIASIETEHILLGLVRESRGLTSRILQEAQITQDQVRAAVDNRAALFKETLPTSVEIPFSEETKAVLQYSVEEANGLGHSYIGVEHQLLALLRDRRTVAGSILTKFGLEHDAVRKKIVQMLGHATVAAEEPTSTTVDLGAVFDDVKSLVDQLAQAPTGSLEAKQLVARIKNVLDSLLADPR